MTLGLVPRTRPNIERSTLARAARSGDEPGERCEAVKTLVGSITDHEHVALTASGRGALLALLATSGRTRAVIPGYTCKAVVEAAEIAGVQVDLVDVTGGFNWGPDDVADAAGPDAVVVLTHQYGIPAPAEELAAAARAQGSLVLEDCAGGLGGRLDGRRLGSFGDATAYSFDMSKLIHVPPKGGALTVADPEWADRAREWLDRETRPIGRGRKAASLAQAGILTSVGPRSYRLVHAATLSMRNRATMEVPGVNLERDPFYDSRFAEWQAEIAVPQLEELDRIAADVRETYGRYLHGLAGCRALKLPPPDEQGEWAPIRFPVLVRGDKYEFYEELLRRGIDCAFSFTHIATPEAVPRASDIADRVLCLPFYPGLPAADADRVIDVIREVDQGWNG